MVPLFSYLHILKGNGMLELKEYRYTNLEKSVTLTCHRVKAESERGEEGWTFVETVMNRPVEFLCN